MKTAFITGITGQDGSYLAEHLLEQGYRVVGMMRRTATPSTERIEGVLDSIEIVHGDILDESSLMRLFEETSPDEIYNLAAQSFVFASWCEPIHTAEVTALGVTRVLEAMRLVVPKARFYQASSSEMFGEVAETPQRESTPFHPRSPYGVSKVYGHWSTVNYRGNYDLHCNSGILFNHESPRRGFEFVTRKISDGVAAIVFGQQEQLALGNLDARRDWGHAKDFVRAMHLMLQQDEAGDFVIATGEDHSVRDFCQIAFSRANLDFEDFVTVDPRFYRPDEVTILRGDSGLAKKKLGWEPKHSFDDLVNEMVDADLAIRCRAGLQPTKGELPESILRPE